MVILDTTVDRREDVDTGQCVRSVENMVTMLCDATITSTTHTRLKIQELQPLPTLPTQWIQTGMLTLAPQITSRVIWIA